MIIFENFLPKPIKASVMSGGDITLAISVYGRYALVPSIAYAVDETPSLKDVARVRNEVGVLGNMIHVGARVGTIALATPA